MPALLRLHILRFILLLLTLLQGMLPLLHAHAGGTGSSAPHIHLALDARHVASPETSASDGMHFQSSADTVIGMADEFRRSEALTLADMSGPPCRSVPVASAEAHETPSFARLVQPPQRAANLHPPSQAPPLSS